MTRIDELRRDVKEAYRSLQNSETAFHRCQKLLTSLEQRYRSDFDRHRRLDMELALMDGRRQVIPEGKSGKRRKAESVEVELTLEQIESIARRLGLTLKEQTTPEVDLGSQPIESPEDEDPDLTNDEPPDFGARTVFEPMD